MIPHEINGYVLKDDFRFFIRWLNPICAGIELLISMEFLRRAIVEQEDKNPNLFDCALSLGIGILLLVVWYRYSRILSLSYSCDKNLITNQCSLGRHSMDITHSFFISELTVAFTGKGTRFDHFLILSSQPFSHISGLDDGGLRVIKSLWKEGIILLPASDETRFWISEMVGIDRIPQYPRAAYLHRDNP